VPRVRHRGAEHRLDLVADVPEHETAVGTDGAFHQREGGVQVAHDLLGRMRFPPRGEVAEVGEQDRDLAKPAAQVHATGQDPVPDLLRRALARQTTGTVPPSITYSLP